MKSIVAVVMLVLLSACASSNTGRTYQGSDVGKTLRVIGNGRTVEEAKNNGFNSAIEIAVGSVMLTDVEVHGNTLIRDEILKHSAGYVDDYKIISESRIGNKYTLVMDVDVKHSRIAERLLNRGTSETNVQGPRLGAQYQTYKRERGTGDALVTKLLNEYPARAMTITQGKIDFMVDTHRNAVMVIPFEMRWSKRYLDALDEAFTVLHDGTGQSEYNIYCRCYMSPERFVMFNGSKKEFHFNDSVRAKLIREHLDQRIMIVAKVKDSYGKELYSGCYFSTQTFRGMTPQGVYAVWGNNVERGRIELTVDENLAKTLHNADRVELSTKAETCQN